MNITVTKYYSQGKYVSAIDAQKEANCLSERFPDRDYVILSNMRAAYKRYIVAQVKKVQVNMPTPEELRAPEPRMGDFASHDDYVVERNRWREFVKARQTPALKALTQRLNP